MRRSHLAVLTKLWALLCVTVGVSLTSNAVLTCTLTLLGFTYLGFQRNWRLLRSFGVFYLLLAVLLYLIRFHGFHMAIFSEFYVLMLWNLSPVFLAAWDLITTPPGELAAFFSRIHMPTPVILGLLVVFRFFPTMRSEVKSVGRSMRNRGLTAPAQLVRHPAVSCEYVLVPLTFAMPADCRPVGGFCRGQGRGVSGQAGQLLWEKTRSARLYLVWRLDGRNHRVSRCRGCSHMISLGNVTFQYAGCEEGVRNIDLTIRDGGMCCIDRSLRWRKDNADQTDQRPCSRLLSGEADRKPPA